ncbi:transporter [Bifidobacterium sp. SMB2]|uniref:Transporter n=1 Tax=Bifidobacterium saimiriisciurei TaxID=2661627 RepID=A0ABX0CA04_9BIFI|nr:MULTISPECIES: AEC family transporter [Bifidobacterium]NEG96292.1 transporter [Bifidobacterium sp. SMB2]NEH11076.1 transporter [Bifidobacterium saimiriisciurei]
MELILKTGSLLLIIVGAYAFKRAGMFKERDYKILQVFVFNVTLPAAVIHSFALNRHDMSMLWIVLLGFLGAFIPLFVIYFATRRESVEHRTFEMLNATTFNIGNFTLPVVTTFMGPAAGVPVVMFDMGNAIMCSAGSLVFTNALLHLDSDGGHRQTVGQKLRSAARNFYTSAAFDTYVVMVVLLFAGIAIPKEVVTVIEPLSNANAFCSMAMVGMMMDVPELSDDRREMLKVLAWRFVIAVVGSLAAWYLLPISPFARKIAVICMFAPIAIFATKFTDMTLGKAKLAGFSLTVSAVISLIVMAALSAFLPA